MITYLQLESLILSGVGLDGGSSQRYLPDQDIIPAINSAVSRGTAAGNWALANRKGSEEMLRELQEFRVFQSNGYGGIAFENSVPALPFKVWSILGVMAEIETLPATPNIVTIAPEDTLYRTDVTWIDGTGVSAVKRQSIEQIAKANRNPYMAGSETLAATDARDYAYYLTGERANSDATINATHEILIRPLSLARQKLFLVMMLRKPETITTTAGTVDFPESMLRLLADWAIEYLAAFKQGRNSAIAQSVQQDAASMFGFQTN